MEAFIREILKVTNRKWNINGEAVVPSEEQILETLDEAAERLTTEKERTIITVGGLKIEKNERGRYDVYIHVGEYL